MTSTLTKNNSIFQINSIVEFKYNNKHWVKGVILSYSRLDGIIIDLEISPETFSQIHLYHSIAMTHILIKKTLKILDIKVPLQLFSIGTNILYKYKNKDWKNGRIIHINSNKFNEATIKIKKKINKYKTVKLSRAALIHSYVFKKTLKLSNTIYPLWIAYDSTVTLTKQPQISHDLDFISEPSEYYKIAYYRDGKSIYLYKNTIDDMLVIKHSDIENITDKCIETNEFWIQNKPHAVNNIMAHTIYNWKIESVPVNRRKHLICYGFIKMNYSKYVPTDIMQLIGFFISDIMNDIKNAEHKQPFYTKPVTIKGLEWHLEFYPCGISESYKGCFEVFLCLKSMPSNIAEIEIEWELKLKETDFILTPYNRNYNSRYDSFQIGNKYWRRTGDQNRDKQQRKRLMLSEIQHLHTLTFEFKVKYSHI
eukprot:427876_1